MKVFKYFDSMPMGGMQPKPSSAKAWEEAFRHTLFIIRPKTQHGKCSICVRNKLCLKRLRRNLPARQAQMELFRAHLSKQSADRISYWKNRADGRLGIKPDSITMLCLTVDSIDHSKFIWPKIIGHAEQGLGRACLFYVSESHVAHDSSWTTDVVAHVLEVIKKEFPELDTRQCHLALHGDNSSKGLKNNTILRLLASMVGCHRLQECSLNTLQAGHSHEDIDQLFSGLATPAEIVASIQRWLDLPSTRPLEKVKKVFKVDQNRAWTPCHIFHHR